MSPSRSENRSQAGARLASMPEKKSPGAPDPTPVPDWRRQLVRAWIADWFHNLGLPTHVQNRISEAAEDLLRRLAKE